MTSGATPAATRLFEGEGTDGLDSLNNAYRPFDDHVELWRQVRADHAAGTGRHEPEPPVRGILVQEVSQLAKLSGARRSPMTAVHDT